MAAVSTPTKPLTHDETQRRVRHPLQLVRRKIRSYVLLEGAALTLLFLAAAFWLGLAFDFGLFQVFGFDWVQFLRDLDPSLNNSVRVRALLLAVFLIAAAGVVVVKVAVRYVREFGDRAVALVLERRFPKELGDRLMTAVEISDAKLARKYGFSVAMVEKTTQEAAARLQKLPVGEVFDWGRLRRLWAGVGILTFGMLLLVGIVSCGISALRGGSGSPVDFGWRFADVAAIWGERNVLLMNSYWPRQAFLEVMRFQAAKDDANEMRVGRDEQRPDVMVRAVQWVVADHRETDGWRPLRWAEIDGFVDPQVLAGVTLPSDWPSWLVDLDDMPAELPSAVVPAGWHGKSTGAARLDLEDPDLRGGFERAGALQPLQSTLDWRTWSVDKIRLQLEKPEVLQALDPERREAFHKVWDALEAAADSPWMSRTLRRLNVPKTVEVYYRGKTTKSSIPVTTALDNKFAVGLNDLKESVRFTVRGEDYYTPAKKVTLVPPPTILKLVVDKSEPAYLYHRLQGDQAALRGAKQQIRDYAVSLTGTQSTIEVPLGSSLVLRAEVDRPLVGSILARAPIDRKQGALLPAAPVERAPDGKGFSLALGEVTKPYDFVLEFQDEDNVHGQRRLRILPVDDAPPEMAKEPDLLARLSKPLVKQDQQANQMIPPNAYLITPVARLPFDGKITDDHGLTRVGWQVSVRRVDVELLGRVGPTGEKTTGLMLQGSAPQRRGGLVASALHLLGPIPNRAAASYLAWVSATLAFDLQQKDASVDTVFTLEEFRKQLDRRSLQDLPATALKDALTRPAQLLPAWTFEFDDESRFDLRLLLPKLKAKELDQEAQQHYLIQLFITATDNNVEAGSTLTDENGKTLIGKTTRNKAPFNFLVVSENELLARIAMDEAVLYEKLDKVHEKVKGGTEKVRQALRHIDDTSRLLQGGLSDDDTTYIRVDEARKAVLDSASTTRDIATDYGHLLRNMEINRVASNRFETVRDKIVYPLEDLVAADKGQFALAGDAVQKSFDLLELDANAKLAPTPERHQAHLRQSLKTMESLRDQINTILIAMNEGIVESKLIENLVVIERSQRENARTLQLLHRQETEKILQDVLKGTK